MEFITLPIIPVLNRDKVYPQEIFSDYYLLNNFSQIITNIVTNFKFIQALFPCKCGIGLIK